MIARLLHRLGVVWRGFGAVHDRLQPHMSIGIHFGPNSVITVLCKLFYQDFFAWGHRAPVVLGNLRGRKWFRWRKAVIYLPLQYIDSYST